MVLILRQPRRVVVILKITSCGASSAAFGMSKHALHVYHHTPESIEAHLTIVFVALALSHWIEPRTGWNIREFVRTARRYRTVRIRAGRQTLTAAERLTRRPR
jgi:hypothetical protein